MKFYSAQVSGGHCTHSFSISAKWLVLWYLPLPPNCITSSSPCPTATALTPPNFPIKPCFVNVMLGAQAPACHQYSDPLCLTPHLDHSVTAAVLCLSLWITPIHSAALEFNLVFLSAVVAVGQENQWPFHTTTLFFFHPPLTWHTNTHAHTQAFTYLQTYPRKKI